MFHLTLSDVLKLHNPYIIETSSSEWTLYYGDTHVTEAKPDNWKVLMRAVNEDRDPIDPRLIDAIGQLSCLTIDARDPWPTIAALKYFEMRLATDVQNGVLIKLCSQEGRIYPFIHCAEQICRKFARIVQNRVACFAWMLFPNAINMIDPWLGLMQLKNGVKLYYDSEHHLIHIGQTRLAICPVGAAYLVQHFNEGTVPPCCETAWTPYYTVEEARRVLEQVYGNPDLFAQRVVVHDNKLRRTP